ncbi:hypothetical protein CEXT_51241 [Caerostris extrusa]|uniref:Uncharacterized protein n=1 Tax=Caerostris extrusa TaxID=172846 RepID=A0AAV4U673_CAEEX|nr:hypothetical protein CEXT_51241 [Caerostris extrusa]
MLRDALTGGPRVLTPDMRPTPRYYLARVPVVNARDVWAKPGGRGEDLRTLTGHKSSLVDDGFTPFVVLIPKRE